MHAFEQLAERRIAEALARGDLDNLPGMGQPLCLDDDASIPAEFRMAYRILRNAGFIPEEVWLKREIAELARAARELDCDRERAALSKRFDYLQAKLAARYGESWCRPMPVEYRVPAGDKASSSSRTYRCPGNASASGTG